MKLERVKLMLKKKSEDKDNNKNEEEINYKNFINNKIY